MVSGTKPCQSIGVVSTAGAGSSLTEWDDSEMPEATQRAYGGQTADARRLNRQKKLRETALAAMAANEWRTVTVDKVCAVAGLNKRYFYESFTDLDALAVSVVDHIAADVRTATFAAMAEVEDQPLEHQAFIGVGAAIRTLVEDPRCASTLSAGWPRHRRWSIIGSRSCTNSPGCSSNTHARCTTSSWSGTRSQRWRQRSSWVVRPTRSWRGSTASSTSPWTT